MDRIFSFFEGTPRDARKGRFPPFGFVSREFRLRAPVLAWFSWVFYLTDGQNIFIFFKYPKGCAQGPISPLPVRIKGVSALRTRFGIVSEGFGFDRFLGYLSGYYIFDQELLFSSNCNPQTTTF